MAYFKHTDEERLSSQQAAELLTDIAYAFTTGGPLNLGRGQQVTVPVATEVVLKREGKSKDDRVKLELELSWSARSTSTPSPSDAVSGE